MQVRAVSGFASAVAEPATRIAAAVEAQPTAAAATTAAAESAPRMAPMRMVALHPTTGLPASRLTRGLHDRHAAGQRLGGRDDRHAGTAAGRVERTEPPRSVMMAA